MTDPQEFSSFTHKLPASTLARPLFSITDSYRMISDTCAVD
jgi:hypothetical protein